MSYRECARISGASQGSVSLVAKEMKIELAKERGLPESEYKKISINDVREHFSKKYPSKNGGKALNSQVVEGETDPNTHVILETNNDFQFSDISEVPPLELER